MYWPVSLGIGLLLIGVIFIMYGQYTVSIYSESQEMCNSLIGRGAQLFFDDASESCNEVNIATQFGNVITIIGIVMAVIGGVSALVGSIMKEKRGITSQNTEYY
jgi:hypothetical protein